MENIIDFNKHLFPVGSVAFHPKYKSCKIIGAMVKIRKIRYAITNGNKFCFKLTDVPVKDLI